MCIPIKIKLEPLNASNIACDFLKQNRHLRQGDGSSWNFEHLKPSLKNFRLNTNNSAVQHTFWQGQVLWPQIQIWNRFWFLVENRSRHATWPAQLKIQNIVKSIRELGQSWWRDCSKWPAVWGVGVGWNLLNRLIFDLQ